MQLQSLRASQREMEAQNDAILARNHELQEQLDQKTREVDIATASSSSLHPLSSLGHPPVTHITATLDLDLSQLASVGESVGHDSTAAVHHATAVASVPLKFNSLYCSTMEEGL